jgi:hypothetical protein
LCAPKHTRLPCCADLSSLSAAALRRCGCAQHGNTPLHRAANGRVACVSLLVERGANKEAKNSVRYAAPCHRRCALHLCAAMANAPRELRAPLLPAPPPQLTRLA